MSNFINKLPILLLFFCASPHTWADKDPGLYKEGADSEVLNTLPYFSLAYSLGTNFLSGAPDAMKLTWRSWINGKEVCYRVPTKIPWLVVSLVAGIVKLTCNFEKHPEFRREGHDGELCYRVLAKDDPYGLHKLRYKLFPNNRKVTSTSLITTLIQIVVPEFRININPKAPESGCWVSLGNVIFVRWGNAIQSQKYDQYNQKGMKKTYEESFNLRHCLWGVRGQLGYGRWISVYCTWALTGLFQKDMAPQNESEAKCNPRFWSVGVRFSIA